MSPVITEGTFDFDVPAAGKPCQTWYKVYGDLKGSKHRPLVALHGGPGVPHQYIISVADLAIKYGIPVILYDQIGCGNSTRLREKSGDKTFWVEELFLDELANVLQKLGVASSFDLLGHSWGGMLAARFAATRKPQGLHRLIISNSPADVDLWINNALRFRAKLPQEVQDTLAKHEEAGTLTHKEYEAAMQVYLQRHMCNVTPWPEEITSAFGALAQDQTCSHAMFGPTEFEVVGTLAHWTVIRDLPQITVPTLVINGKDDPAQDDAVLPFFLEIPKCKWIRFEKSSHMPHWEERERFIEIVGGFLIAE